MNKLKLIQIIVKDLEELKTLTEEIEENQDDSTLIADLALSRARLLCQEFELLREFSAKPDSMEEDADIEPIENDEDEVLEENVSDPELEILHFEEGEFPEDRDSAEEEEDQIVYDSEEDEELEDEDLLEEEEIEEDQEEDDLKETEQEKSHQVNKIEEVKEPDLKDDEEETDFDEEVEGEDEYDQDEENAEPEVSPLEEEESKTALHAEVREIEIDDLDDEDNEHMQFSPLSESENRPVMHEIPKPEDEVQEKEPVGNTFQKEHSLNDAIGENKLEETSLGNGPISSLRSAIGLNDRFLFIREIFSNNTEKYNAVIEQLDKLETIQQAVDYLKVNLSLQKNDTSLRFVELLKRRFIK